MTLLSKIMNIGFIGGGKMAFAMANGFISAGLTTSDKITASVHPSDRGSFDAFKSLGALATHDNVTVVEKSEVVIISVKPSIVPVALADIYKSQAARNKLYISIAMGVTIKDLEKCLPDDARVVRVMPNTPCLVREGASVYTPGKNATSADSGIAEKLFKAIGSCEEVPESAMDAVTALSGSGPAYVFLMIEAMADGGVKAGLARDLSLRLATQTVLGSAKLVLESSDHPAVLRDNVTSPAGSTAAALHHLEKNAFRASVIGAIEAATLRCKEVASGSK